MRILLVLILFTFIACSKKNCPNEDCWWEVYPPLGNTINTTPIHKIPYDCSKSLEEQKSELVDEYVTNQGKTLLLSPVCP